MTRPLAAGCHFEFRGEQLVRDRALFQAGMAEQDIQELCHILSPDSMWVGHGQMVPLNKNFHGDWFKSRGPENPDPPQHRLDKGTHVAFSSETGAGMSGAILHKHT